MKNKGGRPSKYDPSHCEAIVSFFSEEPYRIEKGKEVPNDLPLFSEFARSIGVNQDTLHEWVKVHPEFSEAFKTAKGLQEKFLMANALRDNYAQPFAIFTAKNILGWRDRHEVVEMKFIFEFTQQVAGAISRVIPDNCPHCKKALALRGNTIRELEDLSKKFEDMKNV